MSQANEKMEEKISIAEKLIKQMEKHRDQAASFQEVAAVLRELNEDIGRLRENYAAMEPGKLSEQITQLQQQCRDITAKTESIEKLATGIQERIATSEKLQKKGFIGLSIGLLLILLTILCLHFLPLS